MFQRLVAKFGLAAHVALLAAAPAALLPFLGARSLGTAILWLAAFAALWFVMAPTIHSGEWLSDARRRVLHDLATDPFTWFMVFALAYQTLAWLNSGSVLAYDAENTVWKLTKPAFDALPSSAEGAGFLPFCVTLALGVCVQAVRLGLGKAARTWCALAASFIAGLGGFAAAIAAFLDFGSLKGAAVSEFGKAPFAGSIFIVWLFVSIAAGAQAESEGWGKARVPFAIAFGGCLAGVLFLLPPLEAVSVAGAAFLFLFWSLVYASRRGRGGAAAKMLVMVGLGVALAVFTVMICAPAPIRQAKLALLSPMSQSGAAATEGEDEDESESAPAAASLADDEDSEGEAGRDQTLSLMAERIWRESPWRGAGIGAFAANVPFVAEESDWRALPPKIDWLANSYWGLLCERGIAGCALLAVGLGFLLAFWAIRAVGAVFAVREEDEHDVYIFAVPPVSWCVLLALPAAAADAYFSGSLRFDVSALAWGVPFALAVASFPRKKKANTESPAASGAAPIASNKVS